MYTKQKKERDTYVQENLPNDTQSNNVSNISKQEILVTIFSLKWIITVTNKWKYWEIFCNKKKNEFDNLNVFFLRDESKTR